MKRMNFIRYGGRLRYQDIATFTKRRYIGDVTCLRMLKSLQILHLNATGNSLVGFPDSHSPLKTWTLSKRLSSVSINQTIDITIEGEDAKIFSQLSDKITPYDKQLEQYSAQGDARMFLLCADKILSQSRHVHNKYLELLTPEFFLDVMTIASNMDKPQKIIEYYQKMNELNFSLKKEILYLVIAAHVKKGMLLEAINLLKSTIFRKSSLLPKDESESNSLFSPFFEVYSQNSDMKQSLDFYNLLLEQEEAHSTQLLTDKIYTGLFDLIVKCNYASENRFELLEHWVSHYVRQNIESPDRFRCEYFVSPESSPTLQQFLNHFVLTNKGISLYETYSLGYQFCELLLSKRIPVHAPILDYLSWVIDNMPVRLQSFVKLLFKYETDDIILFEKICEKYSEKGLDEELAWVVQCMITDSSSPKPSVPCALSLINLYLRQGNSFEAYDFIDQFTGAVSQKKLYPEEELVLCWTPLFEYYAQKGNFTLAKVALEQLRSIDYFPDLDIWRGTLQAAFKSNLSGNEVMALLHDMEYLDDFPPNEEVCHLVLEYFLIKGFTQQIRPLLEKMLEHKIPIRTSYQDRLQQLTLFDSLLVKFKEYAPRDS